MTEVIEADIVEAERITIGGCEPECPCQSVHVILRHADGEAIAAISLDANVARKVADDLRAVADEANANAARLAGRLS